MFRERGGRFSILVTLKISSTSLEVASRENGRWGMNTWRDCAIFKALFIFFLLALCLPGLNAQLYTGTISGTVTDPSSAAIPAAKLALSDVDKGCSYTATADS